MPTKQITVYVIPVRGFWRLRWIDPITGRWKQRTADATSIEQAQVAARILEHDLNEGRGRESGGRMTWSAFTLRITDECLPGLAEGTQKLYRAILASINTTVKPGTLASLTSALVSTWQSKLRKAGNAEATINSKSAGLKAMLQWAKDRDLMDTVPLFPIIRRVTGKKRMKGRAVSDVEFPVILAAVPEIVGKDRAIEWQRSLRGLWVSGLRISEAIDLSWDEPGRMRVSYSHAHPMLAIRAEQEKGFSDRLLPIVPDFAHWLDETPVSKRTGPVFHWPRLRNRKGKDPDRVDDFWVVHRICEIGEQAKVIVNDHPVKYASAQDFRRSFGERWSRRVMPPVLMELMRHSNISTTMQYYVGQNAERTAADLWRDFGKSCDRPCDPPKPPSDET